MRTFALAMMMASSQAISSEFINGCQTGIFITSEEQMNDYACPEVVIPEQVKTFMDMIAPMKMMMENMNKGQHNPMVDFIDTSSQQIGRIYALFSDDYDGGEFCKGLIFSHEAGQLVLTVGRSLFAGLAGNETGPSEMPKMHDLLQG